MDPFSALCQKLEIWVCVNVEYIDQLGLKQCSDVDPFLVNLLNSAKWVSGKKHFKNTYSGNLNTGHTKTEMSEYQVF